MKAMHGTGAHKNAFDLCKVGLEAENTELQALVKEWRMWYAQCALVVAEAAPRSFFLSPIQLLVQCRYFFPLTSSALSVAQSILFQVTSHRSSFWMQRSLAWSPWHPPAGDWLPPLSRCRFCRVSSTQDVIFVQQPSHLFDHLRFIMMPELDSGVEHIR